MSIRVHAPDGGTIPGSLCEEPTGDLVADQTRVTCPECLDQLETGPRTFDDLAAGLRQAWGWTPPRR